MPQHPEDQHQQASEERQKRDAQRKQAEAARLQYWLEKSGLAGKLHKLIHVEGGPCVGSAPADEEFVSSHSASKPDLLVLVNEHRIKPVTCDLCLVAMALTEGDTAAAEPTDYAQRIIPVHAAGNINRTFCGIPSPGSWRPWAEIVARDAEYGRTTCSKCLSEMRRLGLVK